MTRSLSDEFSVSSSRCIKRRKVHFVKAFVMFMYDFLFFFIEFEQKM